MLIKTIPTCNRLFSIFVNNDPLRTFRKVGGRGQQCGDCWKEGVIRGLKGNVKNTIKIK